MPQAILTRKEGEEQIPEPICYFGQTNFRGQLRKFGIKVDDRRRHMYVIGKTGMGKTTMMENMVLHDIYAGHGVGVVDPHGDFAEKIINYIPSNRINDVVYFNPADLENPIGFNILEVHSEEQKHLVAAGLMAIFKKIWPDVWSSRMEYILNNTLLALLDYPGSTLLGINRLLSDKSYRRKVISKLRDPVVKAFWQTEFASYNERYAQEAVAPIQNKIGQFLSASVIRNMVAQVKSTINIRELMDNKKILIMNLSKGRIGEDNSRLLGGMLITEIQLAAMARVDVPESERQDFFLYVDEFQNFATPSFANILSEARKYRLSLIMAHQYVAQLDEIVADAVFGNVGTIVTFRVGGADAEALEKEFEPTFMALDVVNLPKFQVFLKLMIDGVASQPFSAMTMAPIGYPTGSAEKVIKVSRERYGKAREVIEDKILRWSGMGEMTDDEGGDEDNGDSDLDNKENNDLKTDKSVGEGEQKFKQNLTKIEPDETPTEVISLQDLLPKISMTSGNNTNGVEKINENKVNGDKEINRDNNFANKPNNFGQNNNGSNQPSRNKKRKKKRKPQMSTDLKPQISQIPGNHIDNKTEFVDEKKHFDESQSVINPPQKIKPDQVVKFEDNPIVKQPSVVDDTKKVDDLWDDDFRKDI
ncbi:MAG TPA: hypothetical protein DEB09_00985 [Candidatus Magasanikbacteria bacterium]|nr:hypothetical protein [Candidatus Magasanikbacteria bacterium]